MSTQPIFPPAGYTPGAPGPAIRPTGLSLADQTAPRFTIEEMEHALLFAANTLEPMGRPKEMIDAIRAAGATLLKQAEFANVLRRVLDDCTPALNCCANLAYFGGRQLLEREARSCRESAARGDAALAAADHAEYLRLSAIAPRRAGEGQHMNLARLRAILDETTLLLRMGDLVHADPTGVSVTIDAMPHVSEAGAHLDVHDFILVGVGVDRVKAGAHRAELAALLADYPGGLRDGPSYIHVGGVLEDQGDAFRLFALGKTLGLWDVITPATLGVDGALAREAAGRGFIMITPWSPTGMAQMQRAGA